MKALYDSTGVLRAWFDGETGVVVDQIGARLAFVRGEYLNAWDGRQVGWWQDACIRDVEGAVALFSTGANNLPRMPSFRGPTGWPPGVILASLRPVCPPTLLRPLRRGGWSRLPPF